MGMDDFLDGLGDVIAKINKWTSPLPSDATPKPLIQIGSGGFHVRTPSEQMPAIAQGLHGSGESQIPPLVEYTLSGMRWLYSNGISQPISTAALVGKMNRGKNDFFGGDYFSTSAWTKAWNAANHISPGQALSMDPEEAQKALRSPLLYYKPPESYLPPGFKDLPEEQQQEVLQRAGMPAVGNAYVEKLRGNSAWYKYGTGAIDFATVMFADPTILAGKAAGAARAKVAVIKTPKGGWSAAQIDAIMDSSRMQSLQRGIWENRDNPQLLNNTELAKRSGMGPKFGAIASRLQNEEELNLFIRTGMGDLRAKDELVARNAQIGMRLENIDNRLGRLDLMRSRYENFPRMQAMVDAEMERLGKQFMADKSMSARYEEIQQQLNQLDELHFSRWAMQRAADRTIAQNNYVVGPARGATSGLVRGQARAVTIRPGFGLVNRAGYVPEQISSGVVHTRLWGLGDYFTVPMTVLRTLKNMHPNGYMEIGMNQSPQTLRDSVNELRGHLARIPGIGETVRSNILNSYLKATTETARKDILEDVGRLGAAKVAQRYGLTAEDGDAIYKIYMRRKQGEIDAMQRYTAARRSPEEVAQMRADNGLPQVPYGTDPLAYADAFLDTAGAIKVEPFTVTRLMNGHVFQDLDELGKALARHSSKFKTIRIATGSSKDAAEWFADSANYLWKFTTLFRLGYIPRVLGDDLGSQWAAVGTAAMALRVARGTKNAFDNMSRWLAKPALQAREDNALLGAQYAEEEAGLLKPQMRALESHLAGLAASNDRELALAFRRHQAAQGKVAALDPADLSAKAKAVRQFARQREQQLRQAEKRVGAGPSPGKTARLNRMKDQHDTLQRYRDLQLRAAEDYRSQYQRVEQGNQAVTIDGTTFPAAFGGKGGAYHRDLVSADQSVGNIFATNKQILQANLERSFDHGAKPVSAVQDEAAHAQAWAHAINNQIMQDELSRLAVRGASVDEMVRWLQTTGRGQVYRSRMPKMIYDVDLARSVKYEVDQYLHDPVLRQKALEGDVTPEWLLKSFPNKADRPDVHIGQVGQSQLAHANALDRIIQGFYKVAATMPADRMSRHPLFNQFYEGHLKQITDTWKAQGRQVDKMTVDEVEQAAHASRQLALRDTRNLVFDIAHRSDAAAAMRFLSPFFSAVAESFQRWGRVIADRPQVVGYAANWYNAPLYTGHVQDSSGNSVDGEGYTYIPVYPLNPDGSVNYNAKPTVQKTMVPKADRYIVTRVPKWVAESPVGAFMNIRQADGKLMMSQNSINMVTQSDPFFNPGIGPIVQIPVNEWVKDKPRQAELARELGVLPYGVQSGQLMGDNPLGRAFAVGTPSQIRNFLTAWDTSDNRYQSIKLQITQQQVFEFEQTHDRKPTTKEMGAMAQSIADKTRNYWLFSALSAFVQPFATQRKDPYQFYRDQYNALRRQNPMTADDEFLKRYAESYFVFAQESSDSAGIPPTKRAVELSKIYAKEIAANPELAPLIIGPEGNGPFSPDSYAYQLNNPLVPGGAEMQRRKLTADEAMKENQKRLGWSKYTARMNQIGAKLRAAGYQSFEDEGAEDFKAQKQAYTNLYAEPLFPDGSVNPYYIPEWSKDFFTQDQRKYERLIPGLTALAHSPLADQPRRTDLRMLQQYLGARKALNAQLAELKAAGEPHTLAADANAELRSQWVRFVDGLIEADTRFGDLYHRYLSRDMQVDVEEEAKSGSQG